MKDGRLQASDLMAGDWVRSKKWAGKPFKLTSLNANLRYYYGITSNGVLVGPFLIEELEPIPLTKDILEKNGWSQEIYSNESYDNEDIECLSLWVGEDGKNAWWWHAGFELVIPLNYVHEFQHALRLCGIDKKIEL